MAGEEVLPIHQHMLVEEARFSYFLLGKALEKQVKFIKVQGKNKSKKMKSKEKNNKLLLMKISQTFMIHRIAGEGEAISLTSLYHFH